MRVRLGVLISATPTEKVAMDRTRTATYGRTIFLPSGIFFETDCKMMNESLPTTEVECYC